MAGWWSTSRRNRDSDPVICTRSFSTLPWRIFLWQFSAYLAKAFGELFVCLILCEKAVLSSWEETWQGCRWSLYQLMEGEKTFRAACVVREAIKCNGGIDIFRFYTVEWLLGNVGCKIFKFNQMFSLYLSTFIMVLIAVDHFICKHTFPPVVSSKSFAQLLILFMTPLSFTAAPFSAMNRRQSWPSRRS